MTPHFGHYPKRVLAYFSVPDLISCPHQQLPEDRLGPPLALKCRGGGNGVRWVNAPVRNDH
jgi:hypothetical protein